MGRVTSTTAATATQSPPQITHFSHPHPLNQVPPNQTYDPRLCSGCNLQTSGEITYVCQPCNFILHQSCASLPKHITHPCHPSCTLTLLTHPTYPEGLFSCDACNHQGKSWSYHCSRGCDADLHVTCASKPLKIQHQAHATCHLELTFKNPYPGTNGFSCDICRIIGEKQWLYRCHRCGFDVHMDCTTAAPVLQHQHSMPATINNNIHQNTQLQHHHSMPVQGQPIGYGPGNQNIRPVQNVNNQNGMLASMSNGFVDGAFQAIGQAVMQEVISTAGFGATGGGVDYTGSIGVDVSGGTGVDYAGGGDSAGGDLYAVGDSESTV